MERPMKWYKFVIYVQLFVAAVIHIVNAAMYCTGLHYGAGMAEQVYAYYGNSLKILDLLMGICSFALAVLAIVVRQKLKNYKQEGPGWYINFLAFNVILEVIYIILAYMLTGVMGFDSSVAGNLISSLVLLFANKKYFDNRRNLFIY